MFQQEFQVQWQEVSFLTVNTNVGVVGCVGISACVTVAMSESYLKLFVGGIVIPQSVY